MHSLHITLPTEQTSEMKRSEIRMTLGTVASGVVTLGGGTYNIGFNDGDETQFDAYDLAELLDLWIEFCAENNFDTASVDYVEKVTE